MDTRRGMGREIGTALAVLAIYLLTLLAPLHQARASQLHFEELGYSTITTGWVLCTPEGVAGEDGDVAITKCPAAGIGKNDLVLPSFAVLPAGLDVLALAAPLTPATPPIRPAATAPPSGPRAPPVQV